jgi:hypothetical protein
MPRRHKRETGNGSKNEQAMLNLPSIRKLIPRPCKKAADMGDNQNMHQNSQNNQNNQDNQNNQNNQDNRNNQDNQNKQDNQIVRVQR